jgi:hypothetical protein
MRDGLTLCRSCAGQGYYRPLLETLAWPIFLPQQELIEA